MRHIGSAVPKSHCKHGHELAIHGVALFKNGKPDGRRCRECHRLRMRVVSKLDVSGAAYRSRMNHQLRNRYNMTLETRDTLLESQGNACKLCRRSNCKWGKGFQNTWHIDHDHVTSNVRGILCASCNILVGQIEKDLVLTQKAIDYLRQ